MIRVRRLTAASNIRYTHCGNRAVKRDVICPCRIQFLTGSCVILEWDWLINKLSNCLRHHVLVATRNGTNNSRSARC